MMLSRRYKLAAFISGYLAMNVSQIAYHLILLQDSESGMEHVRKGILNILINTKIS